MSRAIWMTSAFLAESAEHIWVSEVASDAAFAVHTRVAWLTCVAHVTTTMAHCHTRIAEAVLGQWTGALRACIATTNQRIAMITRLAILAIITERIMFTVLQQGIYCVSNAAIANTFPYSTKTI